MNKKNLYIESFGQWISIVILAIAVFFALTVFHMWIFKIAVLPLLPFTMKMPSFWQFVGWKILASAFFKNNDTSWIQVKPIRSDVNGENNNIK